MVNKRCSLDFCQPSVQLTPNNSFLTIKQFCLMQYFFGYKEQHAILRMWTVSWK